ncbi:MAG: hypothetical protein JXR31_15195 [Prolixibacteraceae bacterium]|nr:hypothetical protein [Prolixibacteraceae bacterium]
MKKIIHGIFRISAIIFPVLAWYRVFIYYNKEYMPLFSFRDKIWAARKGFFLDTVLICKINRSNYKNYISNKYYRRLHPLNGELSKIIDNKLYLPYLLKDFPHVVPEYFFYIDRGNLIHLNKTNNHGLDIISLCKKKRKLVFKQCSSCGGVGFNLLEYHSEEFFLNRNPVSEIHLLKFVNSLHNYIITEYIYQHEKINNIYPDSLNTLRLLFVWDHEKCEYFIPSGYFRFGMNGNLVDNTSSGNGIAVYLNTDTGLLKNTAVIKENLGPRKNIYATVHPNSKIQISGTTVPNYQKIRAGVMEIMNSLSFLKYAGLDIAITDNGFKIIEINSLPTLLGDQVEKGFLTDKRMKHFFRIAEANMQDMPSYDL